MAMLVYWMVYFVCIILFASLQVAMRFGTISTACLDYNTNLEWGTSGLTKQHGIVQVIRYFSDISSGHGSYCQDQLSSKITRHAISKSLPRAVQTLSCNTTSQ